MNSDQRPPDYENYQKALKTDVAPLDEKVSKGLGFSVRAGLIIAGTATLACVSSLPSAYPFPALFDALVSSAVMFAMSGSLQILGLNYQIRSDACYRDAAFEVAQAFLRHDWDDASAASMVKREKAAGFARRGSLCSIAAWIGLWGASAGFVVLVNGARYW